MLTHSVMNPIMQTAQAEQQLCHKFTKSPRLDQPLEPPQPVVSQKAVIPLSYGLATLSYKTAPKWQKRPVKIFRNSLIPYLCLGLVGTPVHVTHSCCYCAPLIWRYLVSLNTAKRILEQEECWSDSMGGSFQFCVRVCFSCHCSFIYTSSKRAVTPNAASLMRSG